MAFIVQDATGLVAGANSYITVAEFTAYHADRGNSLGDPVPADSLIEQALIRAADYLDARFNFVGRALNNPQTTRWPRVGAYDSDGFLVQGIPAVLKEVVAEYGLRALTASLLADPTRDASGRDIAALSVTVGPITKSTTYAAGGSVFVMPKYPLADQRLFRAGLVESNNTIARA